MSFIVQNDEGTVELANAYVTLAEFDAYIADRGFITTATDTEKEQAIVTVTDFIDFNNEFVGLKTNGDDQTTELPRTYCAETSYPNCCCDDYYPQSVDSGITEYIKKSVYEYTIAVLSGIDLYNNTESENTNISKLIEKIGPLTSQTEYFGSSSNPSFSILPKAEGFLNKSGLLQTYGNTIIRS